MNELIASYFKIIVVWVVFLLPLPSFAQDIIWKENGEVLDVFIHKMRFEKIVYRLEPDRTSKKLKTLYRDISKVERINGDSHYYLEGREISMEPTELYMLGWTDADFYYKVKPSAQLATIISSTAMGFGTLAVSGLFIAGLSFTDIWIGTSPPKFHNLGFPDAGLMENYEYAEGYQENALRIKERRIFQMGAIGFGIGILSALGVLLN